jgi:predicted permease
MSFLRDMAEGLRSLFRKEQVGRELDEELNGFLEMAAEEKMKQGMSRKDALRAVRLERGSLEVTKEVVRSAGWEAFVETCWQDSRFAARMLRKSPGFTAVAVLTLALGIGANTAIFSLTNALLLRKLPVRSPEQLMVFGRAGSCCMISGVSRQYDIFSYPQYRYLRDGNAPLFAGVAAFSAETKLVRIRRTVGTDRAAQTARAKLVSGNYFSVLDVSAAAGRVLTPSDDRPDASPVVVISDAYWSREFSHDLTAIGSTLEVNGTTFTVIGVMPPSFFGETFQSDPAEMWFPISTLNAVAMFPPSLLAESDSRWLQVMARLKPGITLAQAGAALTIQLRRFLESDPDITSGPATWKERVARATIEPMPGVHGLPPVRRYLSEMLSILRIVVALVLCIACANLASILLARATAREREVSIRLAVGAGPARLVRQMLTETLLLGLLGGAAGLLMAMWGSDALLAMLYSGADTIVAKVSPDAPMLTFLLALSMVTSALFGIAPALRASRIDVNASLKASAATTAGARGGHRTFGSALIAMQLALSLVLIVGAGLFVRTVGKLIGQDVGFDREHVLMLRIETELAGYKPDQLESLYQRIRDHLNALPGVRDSAVALYTPLRGENWSGSVAIAHYSPEQNQQAFAAWNRVSAGYFDAMGIPVLLGRELGPQDIAGAPPVAVVNQTFTRKYFPGETPVGQRIGWDEATKNSFEIVGVVRDTLHTDGRSEVPPMFFLSLTQKVGDQATHSSRDDYAQDLVVRATGDPAQIAQEVRRALREIDPGLPVTRMTTAKERVSANAGNEEMMAQITSFFGAVAVLLAALGLYGLISYAVARRTNEIGIRMALGAKKYQVLWMVLRETLLLVAVGVAAGVPLVFGATRFIRSQLFGVEPYDPLTLALAVLLLTAVAAIAGYLPALRAARVDPMVALRNE